MNRSRKFEIYIQRSQKRNCGNQLIHRSLTTAQSIGSGQDPESQSGKQSDGWWMVQSTETAMEEEGRGRTEVA